MLLRICFIAIVFQGITSVALPQQEEKIFLIGERGVAASWRPDVDDNEGWYQLHPASQKELLFLDLTDRPVEIVRRLLGGALQHQEIDCLVIGGDELATSDITACFSIPGINCVVVDAAIELPSANELPEGIDVWRSDRYLAAQLVSKNKLLRVLAEEIKPQFRGSIPLQFRLKLVEISRGREGYPAWANPITLPALSDLQYCELMRCLDLSGSQVTDADLMHIGKLLSLRTLFLDNTTISGKGLEHFGNRPLEKLDLSFNVLELLPPIQALRQLRLRSVTLPTDVLPTRESFPNLRSLDLRGTVVSSTYVERVSEQFELQLNDSN